MAWVKRGKRKYFYRTCRRDGQVHQIYFGRGSEAEFVAEQDAARQERKVQRRLEYQAFVEAYQQADQALVLLVRWCTLLTKAELLLGGFHQHDRGLWRKRHG